ncbi:DUF4143 domain-containing protein [Candidatus Palauibacter sp.]|uniref:DUF4143 domain-containing protein n=1 Tax=Candidatus Palauibacter sp. TaxID=3101350 RepID=UPI003B5C026C
MPLNVRGFHAERLLAKADVEVAHPKVGASWEGFVIQQIAHLLRAPTEHCFHWSTHTGAKLDLLVMDGTRRYGFQVRRAEAPKLTRSMRSALETLNLDRLDVVHAGTEPYEMAPRVRAIPATRLEEVLRRASDRQSGNNAGDALRRR